MTAAETSGVATAAAAAVRGLRTNAPASSGRYMGRNTWPSRRAWNTQGSASPAAVTRAAREISPRSRGASSSDSQSPHAMPPITEAPGIGYPGRYW